MTPPVQPVRPVDRAKAIAAGYTPEEIDAENARRGVGATPKTPRQQEVADFAKDGSINGDVGQAVHGVCFGIGDKITAAGGALAAKLTGDDRSLPDVYHALEKDYKDHRTAYAEAHRVRSVVGQAAGAIASPLGGAIAEGANMVPIAATGAVGRAVRAGVSGAAQGGVAGALGADGGAVDRLRGALGGAVAGGAMGAAGSGLFDAGKAGLDRLGALKARTAVLFGKEPVQLSESDAARQALQTLQRSGKNVGDLRAWDATADPEDVLAEGMGTVGQRRLGTASRQGLQPQPITDVMESRARDEADNAIRRARDLTDATVRDSKSYAEEVLNKVQPDVTKGYAAGKARPPVADPSIPSVVQTLRGMPEYGPAALKRAETLAAARNEQFPREFATKATEDSPSSLVDPLGQPLHVTPGEEGGKPLPISVAHMLDLRKGLDEVMGHMDAQIQKGEGSPELYRAMDGLRKRVDAATKSAGGDALKQADALFEGAKGSAESFDAGRAIQKASPLKGADTEEGVARLRAAASDPKALKQGQASQLIYNLSKAKNGNTGTVENPWKGFANTTLTEKTHAGAFPGDAEYQQALEAARRATTRFQTRGTALQGSTTARNLADDGADAAGNAVTSALLGNIPGAIKGGAKALLDGSGRALRGQQLDAEAKVLLAGGHGQMSRKDAITLLDAITEKLGREGATQGKVAGTIGGRVAGLIQNR